ncbi:DNA repair protein rhp42 [Mycena venus]|uniref:DNA repair protein rhp42 n=1 Tax=Mycena venus TaxID=2733690 RepID=A0A8H6YVY4_9AGAR|nr:DNA repair protein rhp42 [Mycena venus]
MFMDFSILVIILAYWKYLTESVSDLLGWDPSDLREHSFFELVHPEELSQVQQLHYETILTDKAATMAYMRLKHKDAHKGYLLCAVSRFVHFRYFTLSDFTRSSRTVVYDRVVGSVSFTSPGGEALHTSSTAQEITVITPAAANFEFRRWHDPPPAVPRFRSASTSPVPRVALLHSPADLPATQSSRTALILDRFSVNCTVTYYSNHQLISPAAATKRPFFDLVARQDEAVVRSWLVAIKTCGVNERGHPSSGGFGYGRFLLSTEGRDSIASESPLPVSAWRRNPSRARVSSPPAENSVSVDAIFSAHSDGLICILRRA